MNFRHRCVQLGEVGLQLTSTTHRRLPNSLTIMTVVQRHNAVLLRVWKASSSIPDLGAVYPDWHSTWPVISPTSKCCGSASKINEQIEVGM
jgi:hypothetical protein